MVRPLDVSRGSSPFHCKVTALGSCVKALRLLPSCNFVYKIKIPSDPNLWETLQSFARSLSGSLPGAKFGQVRCDLCQHEGLPVEKAQNLRRPLVAVRVAAAGMETWKDYIAGLAAGVSTVLIGHPFDTVKVKLQTQNTDAHSFKYRNGFHCTTHILKTEGPKGLYRGATSSFVGVSMESSLLFGAYSQIKTTLLGDKYLEGRPPLHIVITAAGLAGAGVGVILCPTELVKCRLQVQAKDFTRIPGVTHYAGPLDCVSKILRTEGVSGLFRGGLATVMRETLGNMLFFTTYETTRYYLFGALGLDPNRARAAQKDKAVPAGSIVANTLLEAGIGIVTGGLAGVAFWSGVLPLDVVKTHIQTARDLSTSRNPLHHLQLIYKHSGVQGLYAGIGPTLVRAFPANAAAIVAWELTARMLHV